MTHHRGLLATGPTQGTDVPCSLRSALVGRLVRAWSSVSTLLVKIFPDHPTVSGAVQLPETPQSSYSLRGQDHSVVKSQGPDIMNLDLAFAM